MNSTNVRPPRRAPLALRAGFAGLSRVWPGLAGRWAESLFFTPPRPRHRGRGFDDRLAGARPVLLGGRGGRVAAWRWGTGPAVVLVHGWGGHAAQLQAFAAPLLGHGLSVWTFDAPGHGRSEGRHSSAMEFLRALRLVLDAAGPARGVIAHSLGAAAVTFGLVQGLAFGRVVFLGPPRNPGDWIHRFAHRLALTPPAVSALRRRAERRLRVRWEEFDLCRLAPRQRVPLLIVHDRDDAEVAPSDGALLAQFWPGARLKTTAGHGHYRLLRAPEVVDAAARFLLELEGAPERLAPAACASPGCGRPPELGRRLCEACALERELFERDERGVHAAAPLRH